MVLTQLNNALPSPRRRGAARKRRSSAGSAPGVLDRMVLPITDNLTELSAVQVQEDKPARIKLDAVPGLVSAGYIERIAVRSQDKRGGVAYRVRVALERRVSFGTGKNLIYSRSIEPHKSA